MTYNRATLRLYKEPKLYNGSRYTKYFSSESERDAYFANPDLDLGEIQYNSTDGTINVKRNLGVLLEYSYGILTVMDTDMYIFIDDIQVGYNDVSTIYYSIDYYETARFKFNITKGHITRLNGSKPDYMRQPYSPFTTNIELISNLTGLGMFMFSYIEQVEGKTSSLRYGAVNINPESILIFQMGTWQENFGLADGDIKDCFVVPGFTVADLDPYYEKVESETSPFVYYRSIQTTSIPSIVKTINFGTTITTNEQNIDMLCDWFGNIVWECPIGYETDAVELRLDIGVTHCQIRGTMKNGTSKELEYVCENNGTGFCYECRHVSLFVDSYSEYVMRQRDYDVESRQIQNEIEFYKGMAGTAEATGYGFAFGGPLGALSSLAGGLTETFSTAIINNTYSPKLQALEDKRYSLMQDEMSTIGDAITSLDFCLTLKRMFWLVSVVMDDASKQVMNNDIAINGYHCDETVDDIDSLISTGTIIQADNVVIEGTISSQYRNDIASRFERGIEFI